MSKAFTIQSVYNEINGDYFEYDMRDYGEAGIKKSYRNENSTLFFFYNKFHSAWWIHDDYNATLRTKDISDYTGFGVLHALGYLSDELHGQWHYFDENFYNRTGPIPNVDSSIPNGYILSINNEYTILTSDGSYVVTSQNASNMNAVEFNSNNLYNAINQTNSLLGIDNSPMYSSTISTRSLEFTLNSDNLPVIKLQNNERLLLDNSGVLFKNDPVYFPTQKSISQGERIGPTIRSENNKIIFGILGEETVHITSDGKMGIGTADPSYNVHIYVPQDLATTAGGGGLRFTSSNGTPGWWQYRGPDGVYYPEGASTSGSTLRNGMHIDSGGTNIYWLIGSATRLRMRFVAADTDVHPDPRVDTTMVGFGSATARAPLELGVILGDGSKKEAHYIGSNRYTFIAGDGGWIYNYIDNNPDLYMHTACHCTGNILASAIAVYSDERVKKNIQELDHALSLEKLRLLQPCSYQYIDKIRNNSHSFDGFISQEVISVIPEAIHFIHDTIPNIYQVGTYKCDSQGNQFIYLSNYDAEKLEYDASGNLKPYILLYDEEDTPLYDVNMVQFIAPDCIQISTDKDIPEKVFVYGQKIDNYQYLKYDTVFTVCTSALKEIDKQLIDHTNNLDHIETQMEELDTILTNLEAIMV
jgi:hypothetical protein